MISLSLKSNITDSEYLFSDDNLRKDIKMREEMEFDGFVSIRFLTALTKIRRLTTEEHDIRLSCLGSDFLDVTGTFPEEECVRRKLGWEEWTLEKGQVAENRTDVMSERREETGTDRDERSEPIEPPRDMDLESQRLAEELELKGLVLLASSETTSVEMAKDNDDRNVGRSDLLYYGLA